MLKELQLSPTNLKLEITESAVMEDPVAAVEMLQQMKDLGIRLAIDDFGTGYSSLSYLHRFPLDMLKIDSLLYQRHFGYCKRNGNSANDHALGPGTLHLDVVAEGVETASKSLS